ncbi:hypothetical protein GW17_00016970 [Ensete ventricosum]|nr:hypothetical protein GW17_00016970 [Ensete ventricosum]
MTLRYLSVGESVPIGIAISNCDIILGEFDNPDEGEIFVSGPCLFAGYLDEHLNDNPKGNISGLQFRTGDFARRLESGDLVFLGRNDRTVKINGQRVALEEIESMLKEHPEVSDAAVTFHGTDGVSTHIEAYFVMKTSENLQKENKHSSDGKHLIENLITSIRSWLVKKLPPAMIPSYYFCMRSLPTLASGKIDYLKLSSSILHTCPPGYWYTDRPLPGGTTKIDCQRSIEGEKGKKKKKRKRKKKEERRGEEEIIPHAVLARASSPPSLAIFLPRGEKDRGDDCSFDMYRPVRAVCTGPLANWYADHPLPGRTTDWGCFGPVTT